MKRLIKPAIDIASSTLERFQTHNCVMLAAGIAYFSLISIAPMLVLVLSITTIFVGPGTGERQLLTQLADFIGRDGADAVAGMVESARLGGRSVWMTIIGGAVLLFGATTLFAKLTDSLNVVFEVPEKVRTSTIRGTLRSRLVSLSVVVGIGFLLLVSLVADAALVSLFGHIREFLQQRVAIVLAVFQFLVSTALSTVLLGAIMEVMPARRPSWRHALAGGLFSALLLAATKLLFGLYLRHGNIASSYGAAGAIVVVLLWAYAAAIVLFLGAEFAAVLMVRHGETPRPK